MKPIDRKLIAIIPAKTPGPIIDTSKSDHIKELIERELMAKLMAKDEMLVKKINLYWGLYYVLQEKLQELPLI